MRANVLLTVILIAGVLTANAQSRKVDGALGGFLRTSFMQKFRDLKTEAETTVKHFKQIQDQFPPMEVRKVERGYQMTSDRANDLLKSITRDFMDPKTMKGISKFPESYAKGLELDLYKLSDFYAQNFQQPLADVTGNQVDGMAFLAVIFQLVGMTNGLANHFGKMRLQKRQYSESYLHKNLYQPFHFRSWAEIGSEPIQNDFNNNWNSQDNPNQFENSWIPEEINNSINTWDNGNNDWTNQNNDWNNQDNDWNTQDNDWGNQDNGWDNQNENWNDVQNDPRQNEPGNQNTNYSPPPNNNYGNWSTGRTASPPKDSTKKKTNMTKNPWNFTPKKTKAAPRKSNENNNS